MNSEIAQLTFTEWLMVLVFVAGLLFWGLLMRRSALTLEGSFLAGRKVPGIIASLSTVATSLNANDFIGGAGMMYSFGVFLAHWGLINCLALMVVSLVLVQKLRRINAFTLRDWLEKRFCSSVGTAYSLVWSFVWMLFNLGLYLYAGALVLHTLVGWNLYLSIVLMSVIAAFYTLIGGFGAVVATNVLQIALMFFPFVFLSSVILMDLGGPAGLAAVLPEAKRAFWVSNTPFGALPVLMSGIFLMSVSYWSCEAQIVQHPLASRSEEDASISYLGAAFWYVFLCPLVITLPALAAIHYFPSLESPDLAMPGLILKFMPHGLYGVVIVGLIAGVFSSADSQINSFCSMFTSDIYKRLLRPGKSERHYLVVSKYAGIIFTLAAIGTAMLFTTEWAQKAGMMYFAMVVLTTIMPPFGAITIAGAMLRRVNRYGAIVGLTIGMIIAVGLIILEQAGYLTIVAHEGLYFRAAVTFVITFDLTIAVSYFTPAPVLPDRTEDADIACKWTPLLIRTVILLLLAVGIMYGFWSYYF